MCSKEKCLKILRKIPIIDHVGRLTASGNENTLKVSLEGYYFLKGWHLLFQGNMLDTKSYNLFNSVYNFKDAPSVLIQFLATESPLKMMTNASYFTIKALFVLKIFIFLYWRVNFKIYDVTTWLTNNCNTHIVQYLKK